MKKIKRTIIRIRRRELIVAGQNKPPEEYIDLCPNCHFPIERQLIGGETETKIAPELLPAKKIYEE